MDLQLPEGVIAWGIAWVVASLAHGPGGEIQAYFLQTQRLVLPSRVQFIGALCLNRKEYKTCLGKTNYCHNPPTNQVRKLQDNQDHFSLKRWDSQSSHFQ